MTTFIKDSFCSYCGTQFGNDASWPRTCSTCERETYRNPLPVVVVIQPVGRGVILIRRAIDQGAGGLALPGGYVDFGESWCVAAARELWEETGIRTDPERIELYGIRESTLGDALIIFCIAPPIENEKDLPPFVVNREVSERLVVDEVTELVFPTHTEMLVGWFTQRMWFLWKRRYHTIDMRLYDLDRGTIRGAIAWASEQFKTADRKAPCSPMLVAVYDKRGPYAHEHGWWEPIADADTYALEKPPGFDRTDDAGKLHLVEATIDHGQGDRSPSPFWPQCPRCGTRYETCAECERTRNPAAERAAIEYYSRARDTDMSTDEFNRYLREFEEAYAPQFYSDEDLAKLQRRIDHARDK